MLANNHVADWDYSGLVETLETLEKASPPIPYIGAGKTIQEAITPHIQYIPSKHLKILYFGIGSPSSGIPVEWLAKENQAGVAMVNEKKSYSKNFVMGAIQQRIAKEEKEKGKDGNMVVVMSVHWGGNWGFDIPKEQMRFAHELVDKCGIDLIHGHSSHHVKAFEVYKGKLILYGCGDFLNDYEGIGLSFHKQKRGTHNDLCFFVVLTSVRRTPVYFPNGMHTWRCV